MKAWLVREKDESNATVVFAETKGKAKAKALYTDCCNDAEYVNIEATRLKHIDKYYNGKSELDWDNPHDRLILIRDVGFMCEETSYCCESCVGKDYCDEYTEQEDHKCSTK